MGVPSLEEIHQTLGRQTILAQSAKLFATYDQETKESVETNNIEVIQVGFPFPKYPIYEDF